MHFIFAWHALYVQTTLSKTVNRLANENQSRYDTVELIHASQMVKYYRQVFRTKSTVTYLMKLVRSNC